MYFKILYKWRLTRNKIYLRCIVVWEGVCYTVSFVRTLLLTSRSFDRMSLFWEWNEYFTYCIEKYITFSFCVHRIKISQKCLEFSRAKWLNNDEFDRKLYHNMYVIERKLCLYIRSIIHVNMIFASISLSKFAY